MIRFGAAVGYTLGLLVVSCLLSQAADTTWSPSGSMSVPRRDHTATLLPNGKVLLVGHLTNVAEIYDPATGLITVTGRTRFTHGQRSSATLLPDGTVLLAGGSQSPQMAEIYNPATNSFSPTGQLVTPHYAHTGTLLKNGLVLIAGGMDPNRTQNGAELYDPKSGTFKKAGDLVGARENHTATLLNDGRVLIAGGDQTLAPGTGTVLKTAELYDPGSNTFGRASEMRIGRDGHLAVLLPNGKVLVAGGLPDSSAELFDPGSATFTSTGSMNIARGAAAAALIPSGQVLVSGGFTTGVPASAASELYNPALGTFTLTGSMATGRQAHTATALPDGRVLITGGYGLSGDLASAELYTAVTEGLLISQTGLTFRAVNGGMPVPSQTVSVLSTVGSIPWRTVVTTYSGGSGWLRATPSNGSSEPGRPTSVSVSVDIGNLAPGDYYGTVMISPTDGRRAPRLLSVVLTIAPAGTTISPVVKPIGLVFLASSGASSIDSQSIQVSNITARTLTFSTEFRGTVNWLNFSPTIGSVNAGVTQNITVVPKLKDLAPGVYTGAITLTFPDGSTQRITTLLVISNTVTSGSKTILRTADGSCAPTKLLPVFTQLGSGFSSPLAWPTTLEVKVVDDCGTTLNEGTVVVSFDNGDPPIALLSVGGGTWTGTWVPRKSSNTQFSVRTTARLPQPVLQGTVETLGRVPANPKVPLIATGGIVSSGDYASSPALGLLVSIFGTALSDASAAATSLPLGPQLGATSVLVSGREVPVFYVSENQVNVLVPYDLAVNAQQQFIVQRGTAISVPERIVVFDSQPAILSTDASGKGQGHIYKFDAAGNQILTDRRSPAAAGDTLVIYCVGLGAVDPPVNAGEAASLTKLSRTTGRVTASIGGVSTPVIFAGLTPGSAGLYQVNAQVPAGIAAGDEIPISISIDGKGSSGQVVMAIRQK